MSVVRSVTALFQERLGISNVQIVNSSGEEAQQSVGHFHFHILPRHKGDGQDIVWKMQPELKHQFDHLLETLSAKESG